MARIEKSIEIKVTPDKVWPLMTWGRLPEWMDIIKKAEYTSEKREGVGSSAHLIGEAGGMKAEFDTEVTEYVENELSVWRTTGGNFTGVGRTITKPTDTGTIVTWMSDYELPYSILGRIVDKLVVGKDMEKGIERGLQNLKNILEK